MSVTLRTAAAMAVLLASLVSQVQPGLQFAELVKRHLPLGSPETYAVAHGDVDGDGDVDLVLGNWGEQNQLYRNDGTGTFTDATAGRMPVDVDFTREVALGDVDGDGDLDLVVGNGLAFTAIGQDRLYLNDGTGTFTDVTGTRMPFDNDDSWALELGDVDGDGDLDLFVGVVRIGSGPQQSRLYVNNGTGTFTDATASRMPVDLCYAAAADLGDVDGDGDLDIVIGTVGTQNRLYLNNGAGVFSDATAARMPFDNDETYSVKLGDVDGDGDLDLVTGNNLRSGRLYLNSGTGTFVDATTLLLPPSIYDTIPMVDLGDSDGDGDLDLVFGGNGPSRLYRNSGTGAFTDATVASLPVVPHLTLSLGFVDVDRDGDLDLLCGNRDAQSRLFFNNGSGVFVDGSRETIPANRGLMSAMAFGDVDGDLDLDLLHADRRLSLNDGSGLFVDGTVGRLPGYVPGTNSLAFGDLDGDGDLDYVSGNGNTPPGNQNRCYVNNGAGTFTDATATRMPVDSDYTNAVAIGDVDNDGDLDLVFGNGGLVSGQQNRLYLNDGAGTFTDATAGRMPVDSDFTSSLALGDVDGDGDLDMVVGNSSPSPRSTLLYLNTGAGTFVDVTGSRLPAGSSYPNSVAFGDIDGDGDLDLVAGTIFFGVAIYENDGTGTFTDVTNGRVPVGLYGAASVAVGDVDGDGDLDIVMASSPSNRLYLNDGTGTFADATANRMPSGPGSSEFVLLGDVDRDGDLDLASCYRGDQRLYTNLQQQLVAPYLVRAGQPYALEAYSRYGAPGVFDVAVTYLSTTRLSVPVPPHGLLGINPMIPLPPVLIPPSTGFGVTSWTMPNDPALGGIEVLAQAAIVPWPFDFRLTNVTSDVFLR